MLAFATALAMICRMRRFEIALSESVYMNVMPCGTSAIAPVRHFALAHARPPENACASAPMVLPKRQHTSVNPSISAPVDVFAKRHYGRPKERQRYPQYKSMVVGDRPAVSGADIVRAESTQLPTGIPAHLIGSDQSTWKALEESRTKHAGA